MVAKNDVTGDSIRTKASNTKAYEQGWDRIFKKKKRKPKLIQGSSNGRTTDLNLSIMVRIHVPDPILLLGQKQRITLRWRKRESKSVQPCAESRRLTCCLS